MNLYRSLYQSPPPSAALRRMTFAASDAAAAHATAMDWQLSDTLLTVRYLRALQPQLTLTA